MQLSITKPIKYKIIHQQDVYDLWKGFERLVGGSEGQIEVFVRGSDFGEIEGMSKDVLERVFMRKQPVQAIHVLFRSMEHDSKLDVFLQHQCSMLNTGSSYTVSSSDEQWFNAKCKEMDDLLQTLPQTNILGRVLNSWKGWGLGFVGAWSFYPIALFGLSLKYDGFGTIPRKYDSLCASISSLLCLVVPVVQFVIIEKLFPVLDLDIFSHGAARNHRIKKVFWWFVGTLAALILTILVNNVRSRFFQ